MAFLVLTKELQTFLRLIRIVISPLSGSERVGGGGEGRCWECREIETGISVTIPVKANHASFHLASHKNILGSAFYSTRPLQHHFQETLRRIMYSSGISGKNIMIFCNKMFHAVYQRQKHAGKVNKRKMFY